MTNKIYAAQETGVTFQDSGGDVTMALVNLGYGVGRLSARWDRGAGSKPERYKWKAVIQFETALVAGEVVEIYKAESDGTYADGAVGTADAALTAAQKLNLDLIGVAKAQDTSTATNFIASGVCYLLERYVSIGVWNASAGDNLENTANASVITLTPFPEEIQ